MWHSLCPNLTTFAKFPIPVMSLMSVNASRLADAVNAYPRLHDLQKHLGHFYWRMTTPYASVSFKCSICSPRKRSASAC